MITATEARKLAEEIKAKRSEEQLSKVFQGINKHASNGEFSYYHNGILSPEAKEIIKEKGFVIDSSRHFGSGEEEYNITWK